MEKKRVDVKETRNLAKNKGREKKEGRKNAHSYNSLPPPTLAVREARRGWWELIKTSEISVRTVVVVNNNRSSYRRYPAFVE